MFNNKLYLPGEDDNHADQLNSNNTDESHNNDAYKSSTDNHANQKNPNNPNYKG